MSINRDDSFLRGSILGPDGMIAKVVGEFAFARDEPRYDETIYELRESIVPHYRNGETLGLQFGLKPGWIMCSFQIPDGGPDDCGLVFLRGMVAPPEGTRFALRMLKPEARPMATTGGDDAEEETENEGGKETCDAQRDEQVQAGDAQIGQRPEGEESQASDRDRVERERAEQAETSKETLA